MAESAAAENGGESQQSAKWRRNGNQWPKSKALKYRRNGSRLRVMQTISMSGVALIRRKCGENSRNKLKCRLVKRENS
jgi:hypothetical protein